MVEQKQELPGYRMAASSEHFSKWKNMIAAHLGKKCARHSLEIACDVLLVDSVLKSSFLFDYACVSAEAMKDFVTALAREELVKTRLTVIKVEDEIFICNIELLKAHVADADFTVVDVSGDLKEPVVLDGSDSNQIVDTIKKEVELCISQQPESILDLQIPNTMNRTTLFGYLLNYPVLYWYKNCSGHNCLSMIPLKNFKIVSNVSVDSTFVKEHVAWSFSCPVNCLPSATVSISEWSQKIRRNCKTQTVFGDFEVHEEEVLLPAVAL